MPENEKSTNVQVRGADGKLHRAQLVAMIGGGGGGSDPHNLGFYADLTALQTAHPTGSDGDFAILGSTDTVWVWDSGTSAWKDTDTKGQVTSVNGQTGAVVTINDNSTTSTTESWSASKLNTMIGDIETLLSQI